MDMAWIVVKDLQEAIKFYTETVGFKLMELSEEFGWAELQGHQGGCRLGLAVAQPHSPIQAGQNAVLTVTVPHLAKAKEQMSKRGIRWIGQEEEIPGHVKLQMAADADGNHFQLVELLSH
jgi:predicted enzyme related to lactoylglutathione lyase